MSSYSKNEYFYYGIILIAATFLCFINLGGHPIYILDEAKNAEAAREMFVNQNWLIPTFNGELRTDKPPLHYWFMILSYKIFGVSAFSARFFSAIFGILTILSTFHFTRKFMDQKMALLTAFVLCAAFFFVQEFHLAVPDPYLIFFVSFGLFNFYDFYKNRKPLNGFLFYISLGFGILAKGPVAILLPGLIVFLFLISKKDFKWKTIKKLNPFLGGILTLAISTPWFYLVHKATEGQFTQGFFLQHNLSRFSSEMEGHGGLPFVTWAFVLLGLMPLSFFIIQSFIHSWKNRKTHDFILFSWIVSIAFILFFSVSSTKLPNYPMPSYPFIAVLIAFYLYGILQGYISVKTYKISIWVLFLLTFLMPIAGFIALSEVEIQLENQKFLSLYLFILPIGSAVALFFMYRNEIKKSIMALGLSTMILSGFLFGLIYPPLLTQSPVVLAKDFIDVNSKVILYKGFDPAFLFNFERTFPLAENKEEVLNFIQNNPDGIIITKEKFFNSEWHDVSTEVLVKQKALFENYTVVIFKLK